MLQCRFAIERLFVVPPGAPGAQGRFRGGASRPAARSRAAHRRFRAVLAHSRGSVSQRRKTLRNALSGIVPAARIEAAGIDPGVRGETLAVEDFVRLAGTVASG